MGFCQAMPKMQPWGHLCPAWTLPPSPPTNPIEGAQNPPAMGQPQDPGAPLTR